MAMIEARPYRPFKSSEEYLEAMKEDLAEWLNTLYPELMINAENFMDRLDTGVALCKHANYVCQAAEDYLARRQARSKSMTRSMTSGLAGPILFMGKVYYLSTAKSGTFFARDNVSNFITWCRKSLKIIECLLFETDDLIMRKNEKHVILCLLEVARRGAKFGMLAPMLVQMERQIDREIAADNKANGIGVGTQTYLRHGVIQMNAGMDIATETNIFDSDSENEDIDEGKMLMYGPQPQIITNDLKSLDEMVRDLVEKCTCPSQFPMVRVSEGKYRIGDTKVLIFVRILRAHVMVRVGGGWDTLSHYLDKHDPCRCKAQHRPSLAARLIPRSNNQSDGIDLHKAQVIYERSPPSIRKVTINTSAENTTTTNSSTKSYQMHPNNNTATHIVKKKNRSRSPTPQGKCVAIQSPKNTSLDVNTKSSNAEKPYSNSPNCVSTSPNLLRNSNSRRLGNIRKKQLNEGTKSHVNEIPRSDVQSDSIQCMHTEGEGNIVQKVVSDASNSSNKFENVSDNGSEISDEGYRSLGVIQKRESIHSQFLTEEAENNAYHDPISSDCTLLLVDDHAISRKIPEIVDNDEFNSTPCESLLESGPQSLPVALTKISSTDFEVKNKFEQSGIFVTDNDITVDITKTKSGFSNKAFDVSVDAGDAADELTKDVEVVHISRIPRSPVARRRCSIDNSVCSGSLQNLYTRTELSTFNRKKPVYRSVRKPTALLQNKDAATTRKTRSPLVRDAANTVNNKITTSSRKRPTVHAETSISSKPMALTTTKTTPQNFYDSNGRRTNRTTTSLTTSPTKNHSASPLAQQLLEAANSAKNDAQILEKMKILLSRYSTSDQIQLQTQAPSTNLVNNKKPQYGDFTTAWVQSNGNLKCSNTCSLPTKVLSKRSSIASSTESNHSRDIPTLIVSPRRERGMSKIPAPIRQHTELY